MPQPSLLQWTNDSLHLAWPKARSYPMFRTFLLFGLQFSLSCPVSISSRTHPITLFLAFGGPIMAYFCVKLYHPRGWPIKKTEGFLMIVTGLMHLISIPGLFVVIVMAPVWWVNSSNIYRSPPLTYLSRFL